MRFARAGMWGIANYFAVNSSYSNSGYAYSLPNGLRQMFVASVLIGNPCKQNPDSNLKIPPTVPGSNPPILYDSV